MEANKIINSINFILNEDKFSKYTLRQVYDELGEEDFVDYVDGIVRKVIKDIKGLNQAWAGKDDYTLTYLQAPIELVVVAWPSSIFIKIKGASTPWGIESDPSQTNISEYIKKTILEGCKVAKIIKPDNLSPKQLENFSKKLEKICSDSLDKIIGQNSYFLGWKVDEKSWSTRAGYLKKDKSVSPSNPLFECVFVRDEGITLVEMFSVYYLYGEQQLVVTYYSIPRNSEEETQVSSDVASLPKKIYNIMKRLYPKVNK